MRGFLNTDLNEIETLVIQGKYSLALKQLDHNLENENITVEDYINCKILKTRIYYHLQPYSLALENGHEALQKSKEIGNHYLIFDSAIWISWIYGLTGRIEELIEMKEIYTQALDSIEDKTDVEFLRRKSFYLRSRNGYREGFDTILKDLSKGLEIAEQINDDYEKGQHLFFLGNLYSLFDKKSEALSFYEQCLSISEKTGDIEMKIGSEGNISEVYLIRGELDEAYPHMMKCLSYNEEVNSPFGIAIILGIIAEYYWYKGDVKSTYNYLNRSKSALEEAKNTEHWHYIMVLYRLAVVSLERGDLEKAIEIKEKLGSIKDMHEEVHQSHRTYNIVKALIIKYQFSKGKEIELKKRNEVEKILKDLSFSKFAFADLNKTALFHLCDLYVQEYHITKDISFFEKLKEVVYRFSRLAEEQKSSLLLAEVYLFESQLALVDYNTNKAITLLCKAQMIADEKGIYKLGALISNAHDDLISQLDIWENTTNMLPDIIDRMELTCLEDLLNKFVKNKISYEDVILEDEKPSIFLIINGEGSISYSENFESSYLSDVLMNKLTETIIEHKFKKTDSEFFVTRTKINGYTVIFQELDGIKLCYAFMGKSYSAIRKFSTMLEEYEKSNEIWSGLKERIRKQQSIDMNLRIQLSDYLQKTFLD